MARSFVSRFLAVLPVAALVIAGASSEVWAHSGHKHEEDKPNIVLPEVVAQVNGTDIKRDTILAELKKTLRQYRLKGKKLSTDQEKIAAKKLIDSEISRTLILQRGKEIGATVTPELVEKKLNEVKSRFPSKEVFEHKLADRGVTLADYKEGLKSDLLLEQILKKELESKITVTPQEIKQYYDKNIDQFRQEEKVRARVILIKVKPSEGAEGERIARKKIESILTQVNHGTDFGDMAKRFSQDSLRSKGGDLGYFERKQMFAPFSERAFKLKPGEVSEIFKTRHGFHILQVVDKKPGKVSSLETAREEIREKILKTKLAKRTKEYVSSLKKKADVKTYF